MDEHLPAAEPMRQYNCQQPTQTEPKRKRKGRVHIRRILGKPPFPGREARHLKRSLGLRQSPQRLHLETGQIHKEPKDPQGQANNEGLFRKPQEQHKKKGVASGDCPERRKVDLGSVIKMICILVNPLQRHNRFIEFICIK